MKKELADKILYDLQVGNASLYDNGHDNYSGRGMYGSSTTALTIEDYGYAKEIDEAVSVSEERESDEDYWEGKDNSEILDYLKEQDRFNEDELNNFRLDNLGLGYIIY